MAVNVTQKDKTLHDTIDWCKEQIARINEMIPTASDENFLVGERFALQAVARSILGKDHRTSKCMARKAAS